MIDFLDDIIGQDTAKRFIRTAIKKKNLYNFLFTGPKGVGKRRLGFALAQALHSPPHSPNFTLIAPIPAGIKNKEDKVGEYLEIYLPDNPVVEYEDRASILIEQIRSLIAHLMHMPAKGSMRVVLILEADKMTDEAANAFLKTLEEPPVDTLFILTSSRPDYLLPTIRSRCQTVPFTYLRQDQVRNIIFEGHDEYLLGSPGEMLLINEHDFISKAVQLFKKCPLDVKSAASAAQENVRKKAIELLYPLLLLYRLVFYKKIGHPVESPYDPFIAKKANRISFTELIKTLVMLNNNINNLIRNPNRRLMLFNIFSQLP